MNFTDGTDPITQSTPIVLANTNTDAETVDGTIGPDSSGSIVIKIDGAQTQVGYTYKILADKKDLNNIPLTFYKTAADRDSNKNPIAPVSDGSTEFVVGEGSVPFGSEKMDAEVELFWKWSSESNEADNTFGTADQVTEGTIALTMTAEQITGSAAE